MEEKNIKEIEIYPASRFKRIMVFLGDLLINYCLAVFLYGVVIFNIASAIVDYPSKLNESLTLINERLDILYENDIMQYSESEKYKFEYNLKTTYDNFLRYYTLNEGSDNIYHYYKDIRHYSDQDIIKIYEKYNNEYFELSNNKIVLKDEFVTYFKPYFDPHDSISEEGNKQYLRIRGSFYEPIFNDMLVDINKNDLKFNDKSYIAITNSLNEIKQYTIHFNTINIYISFLISSVTLFIVVPMLFKDRSTFAMKILKVKRVDIETNEFLSRKKTILVTLNNILMNTTSIFFVGIVFMEFEELFNYMSLLFLSLVGLVYTLVNLGFLCFNKLNRSISELGTSSIALDSADLDTIYRERGYGKDF